MCWRVTAIPTVAAQDLARQAILVERKPCADGEADEEAVGDRWLAVVAPGREVQEQPDRQELDRLLDRRNPEDQHETPFADPERRGQRPLQQERESHRGERSHQERNAERSQRDGPRRRSCQEQQDHDPELLGQPAKQVAKSDLEEHRQLENQ
jgi:hypothetical protein